MKFRRAIAALVKAASSLASAAILPASSLAKTYVNPHCEQFLDGRACGFSAPFTVKGVSPWQSNGSEAYDLHVTRPTRITVSLVRTGGSGTAVAAIYSMKATAVCAPLVGLESPAQSFAPSSCTTTIYPYRDRVSSFNGWYEIEVTGINGRLSYGLTVKAFPTTPPFSTFDCQLSWRCPK